MEITVLCKVVDNYGDVGVTWRLVNQLKKNDSQIKINYVIDDLVSFNKICNLVDVSSNFQTINGIEIFYSKDNVFCHEEFLKNDGEKLSVILECFQCGRPEWMEKILFEEKLQRTVNIIMIDYLTAEKYAEDFHCLESLTRSKKVKKVNFMPGFTSKTGGLIIDDGWKKLSEYNPEGSVLVFTYEKNWTPLIKALDNANFINKVKIARGRGFESFYSCVKEESVKQEKYFPLEYLNQDEWDRVMQESSVLFIRGEESMSRACLSGIPFVWHAYPQSDEYQLIKVKALLERIREYFSDVQFKCIENIWLDFNLPESEVNSDLFEKHCCDFLNMVPELVNGFRNFALSLQKNGDLCCNLMTFIKQITIM